MTVSLMACWIISSGSLSPGLRSSRGRNGRQRQAQFRLLLRRTLAQPLRYALNCARIAA